MRLSWRSYRSGGNRGNGIGRDWGGNRRSDRGRCTRRRALRWLSGPIPRPNTGGHVAVWVSDLRRYYLAPPELRSNSGFSDRIERWDRYP
jgi:hypothetical protein